MNEKRGGEGSLRRAGTGKAGDFFFFLTSFLIFDLVKMKGEGRG